jgi:hypothetical protein
MVRATAAAPLACLLLAAGASARTHGTAEPPPQPATTVFSISGRGWGHAVGMSQYGALGYAQHGWTYARIVGHYFRGTQLGRLPTTRVRVLLADRKTGVKVGSTQPFRVKDASGASHDVEPGTYSLGAD